MTIALPTKDRRKAHAFYVDGLGFEAFGPVASDGVPEPLRFRLGPGVDLMFVPRVGFKWAIGGRRLAGETTTECLLNLARGSEAEVDALVEAARAAGATVVAEPERRQWGYQGTFADPDGHLWAVTTN